MHGSNPAKITCTTIDLRFLDFHQKYTYFMWIRRKVIARKVPFMIQISNLRGFFFVYLFVYPNPCTLFRFNSLLYSGYLFRGTWRLYLFQKLNLILVYFDERSKSFFPVHRFSFFWNEWQRRKFFLKSGFWSPWIPIEIARGKFKSQYWTRGFDVLAKLVFFKRQFLELVESSVEVPYFYSLKN